MTLTLTLREGVGDRIDGAALAPDRIAALRPEALAGLRLRCGRRHGRLDELFVVGGSLAPSGPELVLAGDLRRVDGLGRGMTTGRLRIDGSCGHRLGAEMSGGEIDVEGDAGDGAGVAMSGGVIHVGGSAGDRLGAAYPGARAGMSGGEIVVVRDVGEEAGAGLRRGLIAIGGAAGAGAGLRMLAGTVIALGGLGPEAGLGNKRGSLVSGRAMTPLPVYAPAARYRPPALGLQLRRLRTLGLDVDDALLSGEWMRYVGDRSELSKGEILVPEPREGR